MTRPLDELEPGAFRRHAVHGAAAGALTIGSAMAVLAAEEVLAAIPAGGPALLVRIALVAGAVCWPMQY